jgi:hypothetical protein
MIISRKDARSQGLKRYFTGDVCSNGHIDERFVSSGNCVQCTVQLNKPQNQTPEQIEKAEKARKDRYERTKDQIVERVKAWRLNNPDKKRATERQWRKKYPEKARLKDKTAWEKKKAKRARDRTSP